MMRIGTRSRGLLILAIIVACSTQPGCDTRRQDDVVPPARLTPAQRDSVTASSRLPGAGVLKQALGAADSAAARAARADEEAK